jgi:hypothetical protein
MAQDVLHGLSERVTKWVWTTVMRIADESWLACRRCLAQIIADRPRFHFGANNGAWIWGV